MITASGWLGRERRDFEIVGRPATRLGCRIRRSRFQRSRIPARRGARRRKASHGHLRVGLLVKRRRRESRTNLKELWNAMNRSVSNELVARRFIMRNRWVSESDFWQMGSVEADDFGRRPLSGAAVTSIIDENKLSVLNSDRNFISVYEADRKKIHKIQRFNPIVYFNIFGDRDASELIALAIRTLRGRGQYGGYIGLICDKIPDYSNTLGKKIVIKSEEDGGYFGRYNIPCRWQLEFNPFLYIDTDVLASAPIEPLLLELLSLRSLSCSTENSVHPDMVGRSPREWNDTARQRERGLWFGSRQYEGSETFDRSDIDLYNSGIFGFSANDTSFSVLKSIYALGKLYDKEFIKKFGDQPIANYFFNLPESLVDDSHTIDKHSQVYREGYTPLDPQKTLIHFPWNFESSKLHRMKDIFDVKLSPLPNSESNYLVTDSSDRHKYSDIYGNVEFVKADCNLGIAITTFNRLSMLRRLINVLEDNTSTPFSLVVCDDGSTDGTIDFLKDSQIPYVSGKNKGIAWNKNRGIFVLKEILNCEHIILMDDDAVIENIGWEKDWIAAISRFGHMCHWFMPVRNSIIGGSGTADDPWVTSLIQGAVIGLCRRAISVVGYMDTRFGKYGHEHTDYSVRHRRAGFGGIRRGEGTDKSETYFLAIRGDVSVDSDAVSSRPEDMSESNSFFRESQAGPVYRAPWKDDVDLVEFLEELHAFCAREYGEQFEFDNIFDDNEYLDANPDVLRAGFDPWVHFLKFGFRDRRLLRPRSVMRQENDPVGAETSNAAAIQGVDALYSKDGLREHVLDVSFSNFVGITEIRIPVNAEFVPEPHSVAFVSVEVGSTPDRLSEVYGNESDTRLIRFDAGAISFVPGFPVLARVARIKLMAHPDLQLGEVEVVSDDLPPFVEQALLRF